MSAAIAAGFLSGALIGGVGGRIAMFILRLTSDPSVRGLETDDGFTIGIVSSSTMFLIILTAIAGVAGGLAYLAVRTWLPERARPWLFGALGAMIGGSTVIRPNGLDFRLLDPLPLAIATFVFLPAAYGVMTSLLTERFLEHSAFFRSSPASIAAFVLLLPIGLLGGAGLVFVAVVVGALLLGLAGPRVASLASSAPVTWLGRAVLAAVGIAASIALVQDVIAVL